MVDGLGVGDVGNIVLRDRQHLSEDGIMVVVLTLEKENEPASGRPGHRIPRFRLCTRIRGFDGRGKRSCRRGTGWLPFQKISPTGGKIKIHDQKMPLGDYVWKKQREDR